MRRYLFFMFFFPLIIIFLSVTAASADERRESGELKTYQGTTLGSVNDFRENSISGVRKVNPDKYRLRIDGLVKKPLSYRTFANRTA
jgi:DMSO/TMAO reductase YedYZ molybdopterin-dependent catalytic subunit